MYRKLFEPEYGGVAPETQILSPEIMDMEHPDVWRRKQHSETCAFLTSVLKPCSCYSSIMSVETKDITVDREGYAVPARIYYPPEKKPCPVLVYYHGGSFAMNTIEVYDKVTRYLAYYGNMTVISVEYRLAPEYRFPVGLEDSYAVTKWASEHLAEFGGTSLTVCGDSSGGNFAAAISLMARDRGDLKIDRQVLIYPVTVECLDERLDSELRYGEGFFLEYDTTKNPMGHYFGNDTDWRHPYASPMLADDLTGLPKTCFISAECDPLLDQALIFAAQLEDSGTPVDYHLYRGMIHGFIVMPYGKTFDALNAICGFVNG